MRLHDPDDHIFPGAEQTVAFLKHREGLADAGRSPQHDAEPAPSHAVQSPASSLASAMLSFSTLTVGSPKKPRSRP